ncbi:protein naked cuticle homolog 2-like [Silurus meridionalis]|uniref:Protein naked cuticle homolog n=1 Tax=Silurus meridionalis TaxID=175797 RepID=A0A8T0AHT8_SILME|nr:protein naked cuticle homolog 2-like [Silurus meridionalis]KAF7691956.1 hypothetical protein HF521_010923 [Silurus meridionalis]
MGKLHSKYACKRRENPEGDSSVVSGFLSKRGGETERSEQKSRHIQDLDRCEFKDGHFGDHHCPLEVVLPSEKAEGRESSVQFVNGDEVERESNKARKRISLNELECDVSVEGDNRQEWVFTLYDFDNSGKVTKEDMSSLMHTIYDVVDASVNRPSHSKSKTLRVKLTVTPEPSPRQREHTTQTGTERDWSCSRVDGTQQEEVRERGEKRHSSHMREPLERNHYCVDENTERRNHYLDLAGIENYTSRFETTVPLQSTRIIYHAHLTLRAALAPTSRTRTPSSSAAHSSSPITAHLVLSSPPDPIKGRLKRAAPPRRGPASATGITAARTCTTCPNRASLSRTHTPSTPCNTATVKG